MRDGGKDPAGQSAPVDSWGAKYMGAGLQFGAAIVLFTLAGVWLDGKLHTSPLFTILGVFLGGFGGFMSIYSRVMADVKREEEEKKKK
jgi:F0F1-type ATP synthase assembly protein I